MIYYLYAIYAVIKLINAILYCMSQRETQDTLPCVASFTRLCLCCHLRHLQMPSAAARRLAQPRKKTGKHTAPPPPRHTTAVIAIAVDCSCSTGCVRAQLPQDSRKFIAAVDWSTRCLRAQLP